MSKTRLEILKEIADNEHRLGDQLREHHDQFDRFANHGDHYAKERAQQMLPIINEIEQRIATLKNELYELE